MIFWSTEIYDVAGNSPWKPDTKREGATSAQKKPAAKYRSGAARSHVARVRLARLSLERGRMQSSRDVHSRGWECHHGVLTNVLERGKGHRQRGRHGQVAGERAPVRRLASSCARRRLQ